MEEGRPVCGVIKPLFPSGVELLFDRVGEAPESHRAGGVEDLGAAVVGDGEDGAGLGEEVGPREATAEPAKLERLVATTERYCVIFQTLKTPPAMSVALA